MNYDPILTCPFDPTHRIIRSRMPYHLTKCRINFPSSKKINCPFDSCHYIDSLELMNHINNCPSRENVAHFMLKESENSAQSNDHFVPIVPHKFNEDEEDWDNEPVAKGYNPLHNIKERSVLQCLVGACKTEKKKFIMNERLKFQRLENEKLNRNNDHQKNDAMPKECKSLQPPKTHSDKLSINKFSNEDPSNKSEKSNTKGQTKQFNTANQSNISLTQNTSKNDEQILNATTSTNSEQKQQYSSPSTKPFSYAAVLNKNIEKLQKL